MEVWLNLLPSVDGEKAVEIGALREPFIAPALQDIFA
jgi:hypothetical protein